MAHHIKTGAEINFIWIPVYNGVEDNKPVDIFKRRNKKN